MPPAVPVLRPAVQHQDSVAGAGFREVQGNPTVRLADVEESMRDTWNRWEVLALGTERPRGRHVRTLASAAIRDQPAPGGRLRSGRACGSGRADGPVGVPE